MPLRLNLLLLLIAISADLVFSRDLASAAEENINIELRSAEDGSRQFVAAGLDEGMLKKLAKLDEDQFTPFFSVYSGDNTVVSRPRMLGQTRLEGGALVFQPRYPLEPGVSYRAVLRLPGAGGEIREQSKVFKVEKLTQEPAVVTHVFPSADVLPENQLKFYIHFSRPMSRGEAYQRVTLLDASGRQVEFPFLELGEELWDPSGTRFTLFFDPGRIKRGLKPREEVGPALEEGKSYTLVISRQWRDAEGSPLASDHRKSFRVVAPDDEQPLTEKWRLTAPPPGTRRPLEVRFPEPLDHAMLLRVLTVVDSRRSAVEGEIAVSRGETRWEFTPEVEWREGDYRLVVDSALEDRAGNSVRRPFEVDVLRPVETEEVIETVSLPFTIVVPAGKP